MAERTGLEYGQKVYSRNWKDLGLVPVVLSGDRENFFVLPVNNCRGFVDTKASEIYLLTRGPNGTELLRQITGPIDLKDEVFAAYLEQKSRERGAKNN